MEWVGSGALGALAGLFLKEATGDTGKGDCRVLNDGSWTFVYFLGEEKELREEANGNGFELVVSSLGDREGFGSVGEEVDACASSYEVSIRSDFDGMTASAETNPPDSTSSMKEISSLSAASCTNVSLDCIGENNNENNSFSCSTRIFVPDAYRKKA